MIIRKGCGDNKIIGFGGLVDMGYVEGEEGEDLLAINWGITWSNAGAYLDGSDDIEVDDNYEVTHWAHLPKESQFTGDKNDF